MDLAMAALLIGIGATAVVDLWSLARQRWLGVPAPDFGLVGRWFGHMAHGRFRHDAIAAAAPVRGERLLGWTAHYLIGVAFAAVLLTLEGRAWLHDPQLLPALAVGIGTVAAPFLLMQPGLGLGLAARRAARPNRIRLHTFVTHAIFGLGLYAAGSVVAFLTTPGV